MVLQTLCPAEKEDKVNRPRNRRHPWHEAPDPAHPWKLTNHSPPPKTTPLRGCHGEGGPARSGDEPVSGRTWGNPFYFQGEDWGSPQVEFWGGKDPDCKPPKPLSLLAAGGGGGGVGHEGFAALTARV